MRAYLTSDHRIMVENAAQIVDGILLAMKATGVSCAKVGIEDNKPDAVQAMRDAASGKQGIEVVSLPARYPQGFEKTLHLFSDRPPLFPTASCRLRQSASSSTSAPARHCLRRFARVSR